MIPRAAQRLETTWLTSRQCLPRPARLYSTPSKRSNAPALSTAQLSRQDFPIYIGNSSTSSVSQEQAVASDIESFLHRRQVYTILPAPLPLDRTSPANELLYGHSPTQDLLGVMDACLHNLFDVPRAKGIFDRMRFSENSPIVDPKVYNAFLEAYLNMATVKEPESKDFWIENAWELYNVMESGTEKITPVAGTYALMLLSWLRFHPISTNSFSSAKELSPSALLNNLVKRGINVQQVVTDRVFESSSEAAQVVKLLSRAAVELNLTNIISELGQLEMIAAQAPDHLNKVPDVRPVLKAKKTSEGELQYEVPFNLDNLRRHLAEVNLARRVLPEDTAARQKLLEESVYDVAVERMKHQADKFAELGLGDNGLMQPDLRRWMWDWHIKLKARLETEIKNITAIEAKRKLAIGSMLSPYLHLVNAERLSLITILEIMRLQGSGGVHDGMKTTRALVAVGKAVEIEYKAQMCKKSKIQIPASTRWADAGYFSKMGYKCLQERRVAAAKHVMDGEAWTAQWTQSVRSKIGGILVECLMDVAEVTRTAKDKTTGETISEQHPAFFHTYEYQRGQKLGVIRLNPVVSERMARDGVQETIHPRHLPMLVKPKQWVAPDQGGYIYNKSYAMRFKESIEQLSYLKHASELGNVELIYAGLDALGSTPWKINRKVFDVVLEVWNSGDRMGKLPPAVYDEPEPEAPEHYETDLRARSNYLTRMKAHNQRKANNHSERCHVNYKIEIARALLEDALYFPHNLDFRGRAYPIPPHLNHIGDDLSRGLLSFAEAKPLGERGLRWLKIHLANLHGFDKANFDERVQFVDARLDDVYDSATKPLEGRRWWANADDPWQCLATCFELHAALESGDPHSFVSSLPIHQDGTCNGLQHYAALGGDREGAEQVNLSAADRPSDVYTYVGNMVEKLIAEDAAKGERFAVMLQGKISRKVVKQTVMTTVYGVTFVGAREQIERQLKDRKEFPEEDCWMLASYVAKKVLFCISDLFSGAKSIQNWLNLCARLIAKSIPAERIPEAMEEYKEQRGTRGVGTGRNTLLPINRLKKEQMTSVVWTTPLGLPIVQPYRKSTRKQIMTALQTVYISDPNCPAEVNSLKQASAFPPNFIHSLDATHMMLTALKCNSQGLTFASVHDSYWTHASTIDSMSEIIRDTFIALHSSDVLSRLRDEFLERYKDYKIPLVHLQQGSLVKQLKTAGVQIAATVEQVESLSALKPLLKISDAAQSTVDESQTKADLQEMINKMSSQGDLSEAAAATESDELECEMEEDWEDYEDPRSKALKAKKVEAEKVALGLYGKFINLTDILPPLPKKGDFNVENIKKSLYFFS